MKRRFVLIALLAITACTDDSRHADATPAESAIVSAAMCPLLTTACDASTPPSYQHVVAPIIQERCASCHTGIDDAPWALDNWGDVASWSDLIGTSMDGCSMPPSDAGVPFTEHERELVRSWAICGAPNN
ncbi:MAG TPA: hypothetical protein VGI70_01920 [Polyangiales bacterium]|jgi:hypothetical protein